MQRTTRMSLEQRFLAKVNKTETCWLWTGAPTKHGGYGDIRMDHVRYVAHRLSYEMHVGPIPQGSQIDHICRNPLCVNPEHLRPVDHKLNAENHNGATRNSQSGVRGVYWHKGAQKWLGQVKHAGRRYNAGLHLTLADAEAAVVSLRNKLFTHNELDRAA